MYNSLVTLKYKKQVDVDSLDLTQDEIQCESSDFVAINRDSTSYLTPTM